MDEDSEWSREPFRRDAYQWYTGYAETRVLIDPYWVEYGNAVDAFYPIVLLANHARAVSAPVKIELIYPKYLRPRTFHKWEGAFFSHQEVTYVENQPVFDTQDPNAAAALQTAASELAANVTGDLQQTPGSDVNDAIAVGPFTAPAALHTAVELIKLAYLRDCDYLLTVNPYLLRVADHALKLGVHVYTAEQLIPSLERFLRASGVFIAVGRPTSLAESMVDIANPTLETLSVGTQGLGFQVFYQMTGPLIRYTVWYDALYRQKPSEKLLTFGRSAFYHRFPFLLYASDLVQHHYDTSTRFAPRDPPRQDHRFYVIYHANLFYLNIAGFLDNLAWLFNYFLDLGYLETNTDKRSPHFRGHCGLGRGHFLSAVKTHWPELHSILERETFREWIRNLTIKRDPAAHRELLYMAAISERETNRLLTDTHMITETPNGYVMFDVPGGVVEDIRRLNALMQEIIRLTLPTGRL